MIQIAVHLKQTMWQKILQYGMLTALTILLLYSARRVELDPNTTNLAEGVIAILMVMVYAVIAIKADIIFNQKWKLNINETELTVLNRNGEYLKWGWSDVVRLMLIFKGVRLYLVVIDSKGREVELEFTALWFFSAFNSSIGLKYNHDKVMLYFGGITSFTDRLDLQHYMELLDEYAIPPPPWFKKTVHTEIFTK